MMKRRLIIKTFTINHTINIGQVLVLNILYTDLGYCVKIKKIVF